MFEKALLRVLSKHLGHYAEFDEDSLKAGIWKGDIVLRNLKLKQSLFATLGEGGGSGLSLLSGQVATLQIKIPWKNIYKEAASITVSGIFIVAQLSAGCNMHAEAIKERLLERKFEMLEEALNAIGGGKSGDDDESGLMANMAKRVIGNLQFNLEDFHLKIFAGSDLSLGITCHTCNAITTASARSKEPLSSKDTDNLLTATMLHKWCEFSSLTVYCDAKAQCFNEQEPFSGMSEDIYRGEVKLMDPKFLLRPMSGAVRISLDKSKSLKAGSPRLDIKAEIAEMNVCVNAAFFKALNRISDVQDMHKIRMEHLDIRPPTGSRGAIWLTYAANCVRRMIRKRQKGISWLQIQNLSRQRLEYVDVLHKLEALASASSGLQFGEEKQKRLQERSALEKRLAELRNLIPAQLLLAIESDRLRSTIAKKKESKESKLFPSSGSESKPSDTVSKFKNAFSFGKKSEAHEAAAEVASAMSEDAKKELMQKMASASDVLTVDSSDQTFLQFELDVNMMTFTLLGSFRSTQEVIKVVMMDVISTTSVRGGVSAISVPPLVQVVSLNELQILYRNPDSKFPHILQRISPNQYLPMLLLSIEIEAVGHSSSLPDLKVDCKLDPVRMVYDPCCIEEVLTTMSADVDDVSLAHRSQSMMFCRQLDDACIRRSSSSESLASLSSDVVTSTMSQLKKAQQLVASFSWCVAIKITGLAVIIPSNCVLENVSIICLRLQGFDLQSDPMELIRQNSDVVSGQTNWLNIKLTNFDVDVFNGAPSVFEAQWKKQGGLAHSSGRMMKQISFDVNIVGSRGALYSEIKLKKDLAVWSASVILPRVSMCVTPDIINGAVAVVSGIESARANFFELYKDGCPWADVRHSGILWVSDGPMSKPTQVFVVLSASEIFLFKSERDSHPYTAIDLLDCTLLRDASGNRHDQSASPTALSSSFCINFRGDGKRQFYTFTARKKDEAALWFEQISLYLNHVVTDMEIKSSSDDSRPLSPVSNMSSGRKMSMSKRRGSGHGWRRPSVDAGAAAAIIQSSSIFLVSFLSQSFCFDFFASDPLPSQAPLASFVLSGSEIALQLENDCVRGAVTVQNASLWRNVLADDALGLAHNALTHPQCILCSGYTVQPERISTSSAARRAFVEKLKSRGSGVAVHMSIHHILRVQTTSRSMSSQLLQSLSPSVRGLSTSFVFSMGHTVVNASPNNILTLLLLVNSSYTFGEQGPSSPRPSFDNAVSSAELNADKTFNDALSMQFNERVIQNMQANRTFCGRAGVQSVEVFLFEKCSTGESQSESLFASASMRGFKLDFCIHPSRMVETNLSLKKITIYDSRSVAGVSNIDGLEDLWGRRAVRRPIFGTVRNGGNLLKVAIRISPKGYDDTHETDVVIKLADARFVFNASFMAKATILLSRLVEETSQQVLRHIPVFSLGDRVVTQGLQTAAANGAHGVIERGMNPETGRYIVRLVHPPEVVAKFGPTVEVLADKIFLAAAPVNEEFTPRTQAAIRPSRFKAESFYRGFKLSALISGFVVVFPRAVGNEVILLNSGHATLSSQFVRHPANNSYYLESQVSFRNGGVSIGSDPHIDAKEKRFRQNTSKKVIHLVHAIEGLVLLENFINCSPPSGLPYTKVNFAFNEIALEISEHALTVILSIFTENISPGLAAWNTGMPSDAGPASPVAVSNSQQGRNSEISLQIPAISLTMIAERDFVVCPYVRVQLLQMDARMSQSDGVSQLSLIGSSLTIEDLLSAKDPDVCYKQVMFPNGSHSGPQLVVKRNSFIDGSVDTAISLGGSRLVIVHELIRLTVESLSRAIHQLHENRGQLNPYGTLAEMPLALLEQNLHYVDTSDDEASCDKDLAAVGTAKDDAWIGTSSQSISELFISDQVGPGDREFHVAPFKEKDDEYETDASDALDIREVEENLILDEDISFDGSNRLLVLDKHTNCIVIDGRGVHSVSFSKSRKLPDIIVQDGVTLVFKSVTIIHFNDIDLSNKINCLGSDSSFEFGSEVTFTTRPRESSKKDNEFSWRAHCLLPHHEVAESADSVEQAAFVSEYLQLQQDSMAATVDGTKVLDEAISTIRTILRKLASEPKATVVGKHTLKITSREQELILVEDPFNRSSCILCLRLSADYTSLNVGIRSKVVVSAHSASIRFSTADSRNDESGYFLFPTSFSLQYETSSSGMSSVVVSAGFAEVLCSFSSFAHAITMFRSFKNSILPSIESAQDTAKEFKLQSGDFKKTSTSKALEQESVSNICIDAGGILFTVFDDCDLKAQPVLRLSMEGFRVALIPNDLVPSQQRFSILAMFSASAFNTRVGHWEQILDDFELEVDVASDDKQTKERTFGCNVRIGSDTQPLVMSVTDGAFTGICDVMGRWSTGFSRLMASPSTSSKQSHVDPVDIQSSRVVSSAVSDEYVVQNATGDSIIISFSDAFAIGSRHKVTGCKRAVQQSSNLDVTDYFLEPSGVISFRHQNAEGSSSLIHDRYITVAVPTGPNRRISARLHLCLTCVSVLHLQNDSKAGAAKGDETLDVVARISRSQSTSQNQIILTSLFCVRNNIERPVILEFMSAGIGTPFATIAPGCVDSVPIKQVMQYLTAGNGLQVTMRPVGSEHLSPFLVSWSSGEALSSVVSFADVGIDCSISGVVEVIHKTESAFAPLCSIISPLHVLSNNLPMPFSFECGGVRKVVEPGSSTFLHGLLSSGNGSIVVQLLRGSKGTCLGQPVAVSLISPVTRVHESVQYVNFDQQVVCVEVKFRDGSEQARDITLFAPFLLKNHTDISIDARKRKLLQSKATEIAGEIVRISASSSSEWAVLPLKESTGLGKKRLSIRDADSALWSDMFTVDAPGSSGTVELSVNRGSSILPVGVSIETGKGFLSRSICVQVSPLISLHCCLDTCLIIRQAYVDVVIGCIQPGCSVALMWSTSAPKGTKRHMQIALASSPDSAKWSIPLDVQNTSDFLVCVGSGTSSSSTTLRVAIKNKGAALKIEFHALKPDDFVTKISNEMSRSLFIKQHGCEQDSYTEVLPQSSIPYVWFDPTCVSTGSQKKVSVALAPNGQQPVGAYPLDKIQVLKTVDLTQQAGLKMYAALTCSAGFNILHLSEKSFEIVVADDVPKSPKASAEADAAVQTGDNSDSFFKLDINIPITHISIVDAAPRELVCAYIKNFSLGFSRNQAVDSPHQIIETLSVSVANVQVDNEMPNARHTVLLASSSENEGNDLFELSLIRCLDATSSVLQCPYVSFVLRNIDVCVDPVIITAVDKLLTSMEEAASRSQENLRSAMSRVAYSSADAPENDSNRAYVALLNFFPMKIALTVGPYIPLTGAAADDYDVPTKLRALPCVSESPMRINGLVLKHLNGRVNSMVEEISKHYMRQVSQSVFKYLGTTNVLGDPVGLLSSLGTGLSDAFYEPSKTLFTKPKDFHKSVGKGIKSLIGHSLSSTIGSVTKVTEGITRGMSKLTFDTEYQNQMASRERAQNVGHGFMQGMTSMGKGIFDGVTGLVTQPVKGAKEEGAKGFFKGFGKGIIGIATKPVAGVIDMASKTTEGITSQASKLSGKKAAVPYRSARGFFLNGTVLPLHGDYWAMQQTLQRCQLNELLIEGILWWSRAASGLVVVSLKLLLVIDASDLVTCIDIAAIKSIKKTSECEVVVFCDKVRQEQVKKQGVFGKMVHSPHGKSTTTSTQDSVTVKLSTPLAADELVTHVLECGAVGGSRVSMVAVGRCGLGQVEVVVVEHEERASVADKFKSSAVRWTHFGGVPCPETKKMELPPFGSNALCMWEWQGDWTIKDKSDGDGWLHAISLDSLWSGMKCQPAKALVRARKWTRVITTRRFNLAAGARVAAAE